MADRQHEPVAVRPNRVFRIEAEEALPDAIDDRCHGHRGARMAGIRRLHGVHGQRADRVDRELVQVL